MIILGIDTSAAVSSVALLERAQVISSLCVRPTSTRSLSLLRMIDIVCYQIGCKLSEITGIAVSLGPGSFTSLRIGLATAQGVAMAYGIPLVGCSTFEALAMWASGWEGMVCPVLDARRGEVYAAFYQRRGAIMTEVMPGKVMTPEALCPLVTEPTLLLGSGVQTYGVLWSTALSERVVCMENSVEAGLAASVARWGYLRIVEAALPASPILQPLYVRPADARLPQHARLAPVSALRDAHPHEASQQLW